MKTSFSTPVQVFGMQKCGSGMVSSFCKDSDNIIWNEHSVFIKNKSIISKFSKGKNDTFLNDVETKPYQYRGGFINIALVRNPFDLLLSFYFHGSHGANSISELYYEPNGSTFAGFKQFIRSIGRGASRFKAFNFSCFYPYFDEKGNFIPDFAFKLEHLQNFFNIREWSWKGSSDVRHRSNRPKGNNVELYDNEMRGIVEDYFRYEIKTFGYSIHGTDDRIIVPKESISRIPKDRLEKFYIDLPPI